MDEIRLSASFIFSGKALLFWGDWTTRGTRPGGFNLARSSSPEAPSPTGSPALLLGTRFLANYQFLLSCSWSGWRTQSRLRWSSRSWWIALFFSPPAGQGWSGGLISSCACVVSCPCSPCVSSPLRWCDPRCRSKYPSKRCSANRRIWSLVWWSS